MQSACCGGAVSRNTPRALAPGRGPAGGGVAGFTLVEILTVLCLIGMVALPFTRMFLFGMQGSADNTEHIVAYNLAREKIEEVRSLPFELVKSDFENFRNVFRDRMKFEQAFESRDEFEKVFTDMFCQEQMDNEEDRTTFERLKGLYLPAFRRDLEYYSEEVKQFRRILEVDDKYDKSIPPRLKRVMVRVYDRRNRRLAEVVTLVSLHK